MKPTCLALLVPFFLFPALNAYAAGSMLRVTCEGGDVGAEVMINGKFRGECPIDLQVPAGPLKLLIRKDVDNQRERVFEQDIRMGEGSVKKIEAVLTTRLTAAAQKLEYQRLAAERAEAARREAERLRAEAATRAETAKREEEQLRANAEMRSKFDADIASGAIPARFHDCPDCPEMVAIPPGSFEMGSTNGDANEKPVHRVSIGQVFALGKTEVTQGQWKAVMGNNPSKFSDCGDTCPVEQVSWDDARAFIQKLNTKTGKQYRLPSEAEWEYACRAGERQEYCGSNDIGSVAWYGAYSNPVGNSAKTTNPVATKQANAFGLYDMSGNVYEWIEDGYHDTYNGAPADGSVWSGDGAKRVLRGGSWSFLPQYARAASRGWFEPAYRYGNGGFRLARMLP